VTDKQEDDEDEEAHFGFTYIVPDKNKDDFDDHDDDVGDVRIIRQPHRASITGSSSNESSSRQSTFRLRQMNSGGSDASSGVEMSISRRVGFAMDKQADMRSNSSVSSISMPPQSPGKPDSTRSLKNARSLDSEGSSASLTGSQLSSSQKRRASLVVNSLTKKSTEAEISKLRGKAKLRAIIMSNKFKEFVKEHKNGDTSNFAFRYSSTFKPRKIENPVHVSFDRLRLVLKSNRRNVLLHDIFGTIRPFHITALMGPSGSGKTTLLNMLRGVAHYATAEGVVFVNRVATTSLAAYRDEMAFVPQDDILYEELTVEENVAFSAILFNRRGYTTRVQVAPMVRHALLATGLATEADDDDADVKGGASVGVKLKHSIVGGASKKGISGGQKKRVSIAMEMMKEASMFFLDG
jgi:ABC-type lipoprotein export system ATPase subunit